MSILSYFSNLIPSNNNEEVITEGSISDLTPELQLEMSDEELIELAKQWETKWQKDNLNDLKPRQDRAESYWLGKPKELMTVNSIEDSAGASDKPKSDNLIFEALETFLPMATRQKPEPVVTTDDDDSQDVILELKNALVYQADVQTLKLKLKQVVRNWAIYLVGVMKIGWSEKEDDIVLKVISPNKIIYDPDGSVDSGEYTGRYVGEYKKEPASTLIQRFPKKKEYISKKVQGKLATEITYTEWWTEEFEFWKLDDIILYKIKNPHWNYPEAPKSITEFEEQTKDEYGNPTEIKRVPGKNHFRYPQIPYIFLSVFNLGNKPYDSTSLIEQNLVQQDIINRRQTQINANVNTINNGWIVSLLAAGLTETEALQVVRALQNGGVAVIPDGIPTNAINKITGNSLPADVFNSLRDARNELRGIFGTTGLTPQGISSEETVRGKIISREGDNSRIGGGISEYLEQFADKVYNWMAQMIFVYYDKTKMAEVVGDTGSLALAKIKQLNKKILISVKEGSMIPKDSLTKANQAIDLFAAGALDLRSLLERLEDPNPEQTYQRVMQEQQMKAAAAQGIMTPPTGGIASTEENPAMPQTPPGQELGTVPIQ